MFKIGDKIVYGTNGVFELVDVREESILGANVKYFCLHPINERSESLIFVPTENQELVSHMRYPLTRDEALALLASAKDIAPADAPLDSRVRTDKYKRIIDRADHVQILSVIKSIKKVSEARVAQGKRPFISDENTLIRAERVLATELSLSLGITEDEAKSEILNSIC